MTDNVRKYKGHSYRIIEWKLRHAGYPESEIIKTIEQLRKDRADKTRKTLAARVHKKAWNEIIEALQHERRIVRTMVRYKTAEPAPERDEFVQSYHDVLVKTYGKLDLMRRQGGMPEHTHWTDYVPQKVKDAFIEAITEIPPRNRAKIKIPFERTDPYALHDRRKGRLLRRTRTELKTAEDNGDDEKVAKISEALTLIHELPPNAHVPNTWHGLFKAEE